MSLLMRKVHFLKCNALKDCLGCMISQPYGTMIAQYQTRGRFFGGHHISTRKYTYSLKMNSYLVELVHISHLNKYDGHKD